jgi:hypothetical protein
MGLTKGILVADGIYLIAHVTDSKNSNLLLLYPGTDASVDRNAIQGTDGSPLHDRWFSQLSVDHCLLVS